jgi:hypothetical protein
LEEASAFLGEEPVPDEEDDDLDDLPMDTARPARAKKKVAKKKVGKKKTSTDKEAKKKVIKKKKRPPKSNGSDSFLTKKCRSPRLVSWITKSTIPLIRRDGTDGPGRKDTQWTPHLQTPTELSVDAVYDPARGARQGQFPQSEPL